MNNKASLLASCAVATMVLNMLPMNVLANETTIVDGMGSIEITQEGPEEAALGTWTLIQPDNSRVEHSKWELYRNENAPSGNYTLLIELPTGTSVQLTTYKNGDIIESSKTPQVAFTISNMDEMHVQAIYTYTRTGNVGVSSDPSGISFEMIGPNGGKTKGITPAFFENVPEGMYSVTYETIEGCPETRPQADRLVKDGRIGFDIIFSCEALNERLAEENTKSLTHVTLTIRGKTITFEDVPINDWFANYVHTVIRTGIMSGYKDERGDYTGQFGPGHNVSVAQLAKVAHELTGLDEEKARGTLRNKNAEGTWFHQYYLSAEQQNWLVFQDIWQDPARLATRAEVIATFMQAIDTPRVWPKGKIFRDVAPNAPYAASIETAATDGIISTGEATFRPDDPINRAELAKILSLAIEKYIEDTPEQTGESR